MTLQKWGAPRADGGFLVVAIGAPPNAQVAWLITGHGSINSIPLVSVPGLDLAFSDAKGAAAAVWRSGGLASSGDSVIITAQAFVDA